MPAAMDTRKPLSVILREAARMVEDGWCQVELIQVVQAAHTPRCYCLLGALMQACQPHILLTPTARAQSMDPGQGIWNHKTRYGTSDKAAEQFLGSLGRGQTQARVRWNALVGYCQQATGYFDLQEFNDAEGRLGVEVIDALHAAAELAEREESA